VKILVVDDEPLARERLLRLLRQLQPDSVCHEAASGEQALQLAERLQPDLLLLDISMPGMNGIAVAARLARQPQPPAVIFCTAYDEFALQALQQQAVAYLLKPVRESELQRALAGAGRINRVQLAALGPAAAATEAEASVDSQSPGRRLLVSHTHRGMQTLVVEEVRCLLAQQKYVTACSPDGELLIPDTLKDLEREFPDRFVRVHRNALVALPHVVRLQRDETGSWEVVLEGVAVRPQVSRRHLAQVKQRLASG